MKKPFRLYINRMKFKRFTISEIRACVYSVLFNEYGTVYYMNFHPIVLNSENTLGTFLNKSNNEISSILNKKEENVVLFIDDVSMLDETLKKYITDLLNWNFNLNIVIIGDKNFTLKNLHSLNWHANYELEKIVTELITENKK